MADFRLKRLVLGFSALFLLSGCVATTPMAVSQSSVTPIKRQPLKVALIVPAASQNFALALNQDNSCFGTGNVNGTFGSIFTSSVRDRLSRGFDSVQLVGSASAGKDADVIIETSLNELSFVVGCWASPKARFTVKGTLRTLAPDGREVWRSARSQSQTALGGLADMRTVATDLGNQMGTLADDWLQDLLNVSPQTYAFGYSGDGQVASAPARPARNSTKFSSRPIDVKFRRLVENSRDDIAVIIGNADYGRQGRDIPDVVPAYADAEGFKRYVIQALGVDEGNIIDLRDATGSRLVEIFGSQSSYRGQLFDWVRPGQSRVTVYYSGHGAPGQDGNAYLVPTDANAQRVEFSGYPLNRLYRNLGKLPAKSVTLVLEACFSGLSQSGAVVSNASPVFLKTNEASVPGNLSIISAGAANQIASWEKDKSHGLFTKYFLKGMSGEADADKNGRVSEEELNTYLKRTLTYFARRHYGREQQAQVLMR